MNIPEENFRFALAVATYVLENAFHFTEEDREFYEFLKHVVEKYGSVMLKRNLTNSLSLNFSLFKE